MKSVGLALFGSGVAVMVATALMRRLVPPQRLRELGLSSRVLLAIYLVAIVLMLIGYFIQRRATRQEQWP